MNREIYMDYAATTYMKPEVIKDMKTYMDEYFGNASSIYHISRKTRMAIDISRKRVADAINSNIDEIYFTSGGSESDNWALKGIAFANKDKGKHIITTAIEHHAVINTCKYLEKLGFEITYLPVNKYGMVDLHNLKKAVRKDTILVSVMFANNEIGTIEPVKKIGDFCRHNKIIFHTDAVQAVGNIPIDVKTMNIDLLSMSSHKFYGPKGVGALYIRKGIRIDSLIHGGSQERGRRAGTYNTPGIVGIGKAISIAVKNLEVQKERLTKLRDMFIKELLEIQDTSLNGSPGKERLPGNINVTFKGIEAETLLIMLDSRGIYVSSGSACSAGALEPSHVLIAIGLTESMAKSSIRFTIGSGTTYEEIAYVLEVVKECVNKLRNNK
ncbi:cysteine desulfurase NifS [Clostridium fermenticellae]|uniref:Cysteine desulfurase IscS n=1 Tax=Clostridium fermenticellae TaxID=2068654 RepID=A0A386H358_9CLOT|nr:cysteine desulfurase NifS [Clostridium fermenticellae]AYD40142.1 cysteine desulfurase NifS [Clostridium fermenticellae]